MSDYVPLNNQGNGNEDGNPSYSGSSPTTPSIYLDNLGDDEYEYDAQEIVTVTDATDKKAVLDCNKSTADIKDIEDFLKKEAGSFEENRSDLKIDAGQNPYVADKNIYTLKDVGVNIGISGLSAGHSIQTTMKNVGNDKKDNPVEPCNNHKNKPKFDLNYPHERSMCYLNCDLKPKLTEDKHPSLLFDITSDMIKNGCMQFPVFIKCNNTCDTAKFGRAWNLILTIKLCDLVLMEETFTVKVCKVPKRDMDKAAEKETKRKAEIQEGPADHSKKTKKIMTVEMPTQKHQDMIKEIAERFGGKVHSIDVCSSFPVL